MALQFRLSRAVALETFRGDNALGGKYESKTLIVSKIVSVDMWSFKRKFHFLNNKYGKLGNHFCFEENKSVIIKLLR